MDLTLNNQQKLICHKTQTNIQQHIHNTHTYKCRHGYTYILTYLYRHILFKRKYSDTWKILRHILRHKENTQTHAGTCQLMVIIVEKGNGRVQILNRVDCISNSTKILGNGINPIILPPAMSK